MPPKVVTVNTGYPQDDAPAAPKVEPVDVENGRPKRRIPTTSTYVKREKVVVRVPATSANLGPGFDAIGMAVDIWNEVTVERAAEFSCTAEGEGAALIPKDH